MAEPVVVQGQEVNYGSATNVQHHEQQAKCQDPLFAPLFYVDIIAIVAVAILRGEGALNNQYFSEEYQGYYYSALLGGVVGLILSGLGLQVMMCIPETLIKASLIFTVIMSAFVMVVAFLNSNWFAAILGVLFFLLTCCYAYCVWSRIPFATINLVTAITAVKANCGITVAAYIFTIIACFWSFIWAIAMLGVFDSAYTCTNYETRTGCTVSGSGYGYLFLLFLAYFFGHQVFQNTIHVTIAGVVATWWIAPDEASSCCSSAIWDSLKRSLTTSFGSICFGSLLVAIIQALRALANTARSQDDGILLCLAECILACIQGLIEYFNKWAFIYVGVYGMGYCESGSNVMQLFANRGWESIIADDLVGNTLFLVSLVVGGLTGALGILIEWLAGWIDEDNPGDSKLMAFGLGFIIGVVLCSILMSVIASSVNAVLVLFAEKPAEFQQNHPDLSARMRQIWSEIYPGSV
ncbi:Protein PNS1 [Seminavis robusta]|uniref:Choline transporter-like protein n=1 Tax=Seminavis robusta TaxID=568900 RepID=A0A9N8HWA1_9STRA|nr:Protein PNS1 [Seminavis robusta]|eukprot:Sro2165_g317240.1 Protein PNS1 (465) ;mRNA; f:9538-11198